MKKTPLFLLIGLVVSFICLFYLEPSRAQSEQEAVGLFDFIGTEKSVNTQQIRSSVSVAAVREQPVRINFNNINFETVQKLGIPLFDGTSYEASRGESEGFIRFGADEFTWRGKISGNYDWSGDVILTIKGQALSGLIYSPTAVYEIIPQANSEHILVELDQSRYPLCAGAIPEPKPVKGNNIVERAASHVALDNDFMQRQQEFDGTYRMLDPTSPDNGSLLDVLVVYTSNVRTAMGGTAQTQALIQQAVASTNTAYQNSVIDPRLQLVNTLEVNYTEVGTLSAALTWVRSDPTVAAARDASRADLVAILIEDGSDGCGLGYVMHNVGPGFASSAFSATVRSCAVGNLSFAHELGHNEGCEHNPENGSASNIASYPYAFGHYVNGAFRTVMSYADPCPSGCNRIPYFSNPSITFNGFATGITDQRDNHRVINNTSLTISQFRESSGGNTCSPAAISAGQTLNGTLSTSDCRYPTGSSWYSDAYSFSGTAGQQVAITMSSTSFDTWLALIGPNGVELVFDDNGGGITNSRIPASSGFYTLPSTGTYTIQASSSLNDATGGYTVGLTQPSPPNDNFVNAQVITGANGSVAGTNIGATKESLEPNPAGNTGGASIWYQWQAPASGTVTMTTAGSSFDTLLGVYTGSSVNALTHITSNDDDATLGSLTSRVSFNAVGGTVYRIVVDGYGGETGNVTLNWNLAASCSYSISPPTRSFTSASGTGSITVTAGAGCTWTASSNAAWLVITSGSSGTGNGTVSYSVSANTGASSRSGAITVAGQGFTGTHTVSQSQPSVLTVASLNPASGVSISVSPTDINVLGNGTTQFTRTYHTNTSVSLTAPATASGNTFQKWQRDGADWTTNLSTSLTMDSNHTMTAVYIPKVQVTIQTSPSGRTFTVDGVSYSAAVTLSWNAGSLHTISTTTTQSAGTGAQYVWSNWSDGGAISHSVSPAINTTYTANFVLATQPTVSTTAATAVASTSGTLNGLINPNGSATNGWFEWGTSSSLVTFNSTPVQAMDSGGASLAINSTLANLNPTTTYYYRVAASNSLGTSRGAILSFTTPLPSVNVLWTNTVGVSVSGNTLTKTASSVWGNAGASSSQSLTSGDGYMEFTASTNTDARLAGLSRGDTDQNWQDVDFGIDPANNGQVYIYEAGVARGVFGSYASGDRFRIAVVGGVVKYYRNGALLYTSTIAPSYPLLVDSAIYSTGASVTDAVIAGLSLQSTLPPTENVAWANIVGATASGNTLIKTASSIWGNSGASSTRAIASGDGYMEFTASSNTDARLAGLSRGDTDQNWQDVDFGIDPANNGQVYIYEAGVARGVFGSYASGDRFRVAIEGGVVKYYRNGALLYTSTIAPSYPMLVDSALYNTGVTVSDAVIGGAALQTVSTITPAAQNVAWANIVGATASGNTLTKTASSVWGNAGASSSQSLTSGDGYMEFTASTNTDARLAGLSRGDTDQNWQDVDFGIDPANNGQVYIYEAGIARGVFGSYASGDRFKVAVEGGVVKYYRSGVLLYTSTVAPSYPLLVDSAIYSTGASVTDAVIAGSSLLSVPTTENAAWANIVGVTVSNNTLTKFAPAGWGNSGASSTRAISSGDGYMEFTASSNTDARLAGLSRGDTDQNWQDVDFGIDPANNGQVYIYEAGVARGVFGSYASGDRFKVAIEGGVVKYYKNSSLLYTSTVAPTYPLLVDTALYGTGVTVSNVVISGFLQSATATVMPLDKADSPYAWAAGSAVPLNGLRSPDLYAAIAGYYDRKFGRRQTGMKAPPLTFYIAKGTYRP